MKRSVPLIACLTVLSFLTVACSGDDDSTNAAQSASPQDRLADEFLAEMDEDAGELIDAQCIRDLLGLIKDDDAEEILAMMDAGLDSVPADVDPELRILLDDLAFRLFDCVIFDVEGLEDDGPVEG